MSRLWSIFAGLLALSLALPALAEEVLRVGDQRGGSKALLEAAGTLADLPFRIEWSEFPAAAPLLEALNAGAIDLGGVGDAPFTFGAAAGVEVKAVAAVRSSQQGLAILVSADSPIRSITDLKGKRIATGKGSIGHQLVLAALDKAGLPFDAVTFVFALPADAKAAWSSGAVDGWSTWEPYVSQEELLGGARRAVDGVDLTPGLGFQVARLDAISGKRAMVAEFLKRLAAAWRWEQSNIDAYAERWSALMGVPKPVALQWFTRTATRLVAIDDTVVADEQRTIDLYAKAGLLRTKLRAGQILDSSFTPAISVAEHQP